MKHLLAVLVFFLFGRQASAQISPGNTAIVLAALQDTQVIRHAIGKPDQEDALFQIRMPDTSFLYATHGIIVNAANDHHTPKNLHNLTIKKIGSSKHDEAYLKAVLDSSIILRAHLRKTGYRWIVVSRSVHSKNWLLKKDDFYFSNI